MEEENPHELPEETFSEMLDKMSALAWCIRNDWSDPRHECREIVRISNKIKKEICQE
jgi:hypothetical protein